MLSAAAASYARVCVPVPSFELKSLPAPLHPLAGRVFPATSPGAALMGLRGFPCTLSPRQACRRGHPRSAGVPLPLESDRSQNVARRAGRAGEGWPLRGPEH